MDLNKILFRLNSSLPDQFDYSNLNNALNFLFHESVNISKSGNTIIALENIEVVLEKTWEFLHTGSWADVSDDMRKLYSHASLFKTKLLLNCSQNEDSIKKAIKAVDMGLLMGNSFRDELTEAATFLCKILQPNTNFIKDQIEIPKHLNDECILGHFDKIMSISTSEQPSLETFYRDYLKLKIPVKITGAMSHWPAMKKWKDLNYIIKTAGCRTVPVEIGSSYADEDWSQTLITIEEFIKDKVINPNEKTTYLAQHQLFNQIPELKEDIKVPDYCYLSEADDNEPDINAWFGPKGTISPTHYDPKNNFLAQVVGFKDIFLFDPKWTDCLYPYEEKLLKNTAQVDPTKPNLNTYPKFTEVEAIHCILSEALCILGEFLNSLFYIFNDLMSGDCCWIYCTVSASVVHG